MLSAVGCVADRAARLEVVDLRRQIDGLRRQTERDRRTMDEFDNRVAVLELEQKAKPVAPSAQNDDLPRLPVVSKKPEPSPVPQAESQVVIEDPRSDVIVVYEGDAARAGPAHKLALDEQPEMGASPQATRARSMRSPRREVTLDLPVPNPGAEDRIPVVPLWDGGANPAHDHDPVASYKTAYAALGSKNHGAAIEAFRRFLARWPDHDYADNAQYWLAEAYYDKRDYAAALPEFRQVVTRYPRGSKAPDALLKVGYCHAKLGDPKAARDVLVQVLEIYPRTEAAKLAAQRLEEMR